MDMNKVVQFNSRTAGRDKLARLIQYTSRIVWHGLQQNHANQRYINHFKTLEYILSNFRKLLRFGRCMDALHEARKLMHHSDVLIRWNCSFAKVAYAIYLLCDHMIWLGRVGFADVNISKWNRTANKYWLLNVALQLVRDYVEIKRLLESKTDKSFKLDTPSVAYKEFHRFVFEHKDVVMDTIKNGCDFFIPLAALGIVKCSPRTVGLMGVISSSVGIYTILDPFAKLPLT